MPYPKKKSCHTRQHLQCSFETSEFNSNAYVERLARASTYLLDFDMEEEWSDIDVQN